MSSTMLKMEITGLMERQSPLEISFDPDHNFFVGQNGTGKTTVINLLAATLLCDFEKLEKISFEKVKIDLINESGRPVTISAEKGNSENNPFTDVKYSFDIDGKISTFDLDEYGLEMRSRAAHSISFKRQLFRHHVVNAKGLIAKHVNARWLSINRASDAMENSPDGRHLPAIDRKLQELTNEIAKYFGRLSKSYADRTTNFQQTSLLSVIRSESKFTFEKFFKELDIDAEQEALKHAFDALGMPEIRYKATLRSHFQDLKSSIEVIKEKTGEAYHFDQMYSIYNGWKVHNLVNEYKKLEQEKGLIFKPRDTFIETINSLFQPRKQVKVSARNELAVEVVSGAVTKEIDFSDLSSGEKQLLIILGEALLQESSSAIYIADEPELSLHVSWQTKITGAIKAINPKAQIVFATHSPDIVNVHSENIIDMESI